MKSIPLFSALLLIAAMFIATPTFAQNKHKGHKHKKAHVEHKSHDHKAHHVHKKHKHHSHSHTVIVAPHSHQTTTVITQSRAKRPPVGTVVYSIPSGYTVVEYRGAKHYYVNGVYYRPEIRNGKPIYIIANF